MPFLFQFEARSEDCRSCIPMEVRLKLDCVVSNCKFLGANARSKRVDGLIT
jgi:hypothetical protein